MFYVYILKSDRTPEDGAAKAYYYVGSTSDLRRRLAEHNRGDCLHTQRYRPWTVVNYVAFLSRRKAEDFERYLMSRAGRRFQLLRLAD